jgi:hypothetical protein
MDLIALFKLLPTQSNMSNAVCVHTAGALRIPIARAVTKAIRAPSIRQVQKRQHSAHVTLAILEPLTMTVPSVLLAFGAREAKWTWRSNMSSARRRRAVLLGLMIAPTANVLQVRAGASTTVSGFLLRISTTCSARRRSLACLLSQSFSRK